MSTKSTSSEVASPGVPNPGKSTAAPSAEQPAKPLLQTVPGLVDIGIDAAGVCGPDGCIDSAAEIRLTDPTE